ncbi:MAG: lipocalin-like domain-containing protein [Woeseiaceae bacterium]
MPRLKLWTVLIFLLPAATALAQEGDSKLATLLGAGDNDSFAKAIDPRQFTFPDDHGPHTNFRNEWWYVTGNLDGDDGRRFGYELTIFRFSLTPTDVEAESDWRTNQVYVAHFAITDVDGDRFLVSEKYSRGALGLAGATAAPFRVWIDDWEIRSVADLKWRLRAVDPAFSLNLVLDLSKPPVLNGDEGLSQKSDEPGNASYYYSITRMQTDGELQINGDRYGVSGTSWLDREWSSSALAADQRGWDWFALQLSDKSEMMFYQLRKTDGSQDANSAGTWVDPQGQTTHLARDDVQVEVTDSWDSPQGGTYPSGWRIRVPSRNLVLDVTPVMADQELFTTVRYWEGAVDIIGQRDGVPIEGRGYVELTGYAEGQ